MFISIELVSQIVTDVKDQLMRDAVRSIRQKKAEDGLSCIAQIDGADLVKGALADACMSQIYRERGLVISGSEAPAAPVRKKPGAKVARIPSPAPAIRKREKVQVIKPAVGE